MIAKICRNRIQPEDVSGRLFLRFETEPTNVILELATQKILAAIRVDT